MDIKSLLKTFTCSCGKNHSCDIKDVFIEKNAAAKIPGAVKNYNTITVVCDKNTYKVYGKEVENSLCDKNFKTVIFEDELLVPDESAIERLTSALLPCTDLIIGIGSGVIQDLSKYVSFEKKIPYHIAATAPSMDGYASKGAAMIIGNMKITYNAHVPEVIYADTDVLKNAPLDMIKSGFGDIVGKYSCLNDWKLSHVVNSEYICDYVYNLTFDMLLSVKDSGEKLLARDEDAVKKLMEALVGVGVAMAYVGNSRPASGSEHHMSHFFEVTGIMNNAPYFMHGTDVLYSAYCTQKMREELLSLSAISPRPFIKADWAEKIKNIYGEAAEGVIALQEKLGWYEEDKFPLYKEKWDEIKAVLSEVPSSSELLALIESIGLDIAEFTSLYGEEKIKNAMLYAKDLKDRYSVLWLYFALEV